MFALRRPRELPNLAQMNLLRRKLQEASWHLNFIVRAIKQRVLCKFIYESSRTQEEMLSLRCDIWNICNHNKFTRTQEKGARKVDWRQFAGSFSSWKDVSQFSLSFSTGKLWIEAEVCVDLSVYLKWHECSGRQDVEAFENMVQRKIQITSETRVAWVWNIVVIKIKCWWLKIF